GSAGSAPRVRSASAASRARGGGDYERPCIHRRTGQVKAGSTSAGTGALLDSAPSRDRSAAHFPYLDSQFMAGNGDTTRAILFALGANFAIAVAKGVAAFFTGSSAMLAETVHSLADCGNQLLLLLGMRPARKPPSPEYPLGYGKAIYFWSFLVAVMLFTVGGMFSLYEGIHKLQHPEPLKQWWWAAGGLVVGLVAEG